MFREMRRIKQQISNEECVTVLEEAPRGTMAVLGEDGYPYVFPMNHIYIDGKLYFHCAKTGHKLDAILENNKVSFCTMDTGYRNPGEWWWNIKSVIIFGTIRIVEDDATRNMAARQLGLKHYPTEESVDELMKTHMQHLVVLELTIDHMTGKLVDES